MRRAALVAGALTSGVMLVLTHCSAFSGKDADGSSQSSDAAANDDSSATTEDGSTSADDAGNPTIAQDGGKNVPTAFCDTLTPRPVFCTDFDETTGFPRSPLTIFHDDPTHDVTIRSDAGGAFSAPYFFRSAITTPMGQAELQALNLLVFGADAGVNGGSPNVHLRARLRPLATNYTDVEYAFFTLSTPGSKVVPLFFLVLDAGQVNLWLGPYDMGNGAAIDGTCNQTIVANQWLEVDVKYAPKTRSYEIKLGTKMCSGTANANVQFIPTDPPWQLGAILGENFGMANYHPMDLDNFALSIE